MTNAVVILFLNDFPKFVAILWLFVVETYQEILSTFEAVASAYWASLINSLNQCVKTRRLTWHKYTNIKKELGLFVGNTDIMVHMLQNLKAPFELSRFIRVL